MPSPRPVNPIPSLLVAVTWSRTGVDVRGPPRRRRHRVEVGRQPRLLGDDHDVGGDDAEPRRGA